MLTLNEAIKHCHEKAEEIRKANEEMPTDCKLSEDLCECAKEHEQLAAWLEELAERREADRWIPVSERLPEENGEYLVTRKAYIDRRNRNMEFVIDIASFTIGYGLNNGFHKANTVIAWKPLPKTQESEATNEQEM